MSTAKRVNKSTPVQAERFLLAQPEVGPQSLITHTHTHTHTVENVWCKCHFVSCLCSAPQGFPQTFPLHTQPSAVHYFQRDVLKWCMCFDHQRLKYWQPKGPLPRTAYCICEHSPVSNSPVYLLLISLRRLAALFVLTLVLLLGIIKTNLCNYWLKLITRKKRKSY